MEQQQDKNTGQNQNKESTEVQQKRGPKLREEMIRSQKEGEQFRAQNQGADVAKTPGLNPESRSTDKDKRNEL